MLKLFLIYFIIQILNIPRWRCIFGVTKSTICVCVLAYLKRRVRKMDVDFFPRLPIDILFYHWTSGGSFRIKVDRWFVITDCGVHFHERMVKTEYRYILCYRNTCVRGPPRRNKRESWVFRLVPSSDVFSFPCREWFETCSATVWPNSFVCYCAEGVHWRLCFLLYPFSNTTYIVNISGLTM